MKLRHLLASAALALSSFYAYAEAITVNLTNTGGAVWTADFGNVVNVAGNFTDTFTFVPDLSGSTSGSITTQILLTAPITSNIDFTSVSLNGNPFTLSLNGPFEFGFLTFANITAPIVLTVIGTSGGGASYGGNFNLQAVPEPGTLALLGLAGLGLAFSRRRKETQV